MPSRPNPVGSWSEYFASMIDKPLHPILKRLEPFLPEKGEALELGAGVGHGVVFLVDRGLTVTAVDAEPQACQILRERARSATVVESRFEDVDLPENRFDVVVAGFSLFFLTAADMADFWPKLISSMKSGCLFAGEFLGMRDDWVAEGYLGHPEDEIRNLFGGFEILSWEEAERDGKTSMGTDKHWHVYHVVAKSIAQRTI